MAQIVFVTSSFTPQQYRVRPFRASSLLEEKKLDQFDVERLEDPVVGWLVS